MVGFDSFLARMAVRDAATLLVHSSRSALILADRAGAIRLANPRAAALFPDDAKAGGHLQALLHAMQMDSDGLARGEEQRTIVPLGPNGEQHLCRLVRVGRPGPYRWLVVMYLLPPAPQGPSGALSELAATAAHEIRNPLTTVRGILEELHLRQPEAGSGHTEIALRELDRVNALLTDLMSLTVPYDAGSERVDLRAVAREVAAACEAGLALRGQYIELALDTAPVPCAGSAPALHQVLLNLVRNAGEAAPDETRITVEVQRTGSVCTVKVLDHGPGFPPAVLPHVFDPFFTTKRGGTGLGLAVCQRIVASGGGTISAFNRLEGGGGIVIQLPAKP